MGCCVAHGDDPSHMAATGTPGLYLPYSKRLEGETQDFQPKGRKGHSHLKLDDTEGLQTPKRPRAPPCTPSVASEAEVLAAAMGIAAAIGAKLPEAAAQARGSGFSRSCSNLTCVSRYEDVPDEEGVSPLKSILRTKSAKETTAYTKRDPASPQPQRCEKRRVTLGKAEIREYKVVALKSCRSKSF